jgi:hypothetical protein
VIGSDTAEKINWGFGLNLVFGEAALPNKILKKLGMSILGGNFEDNFGRSA